MTRSLLKNTDQDQPFGTIHNCVKKKKPSKCHTPSGDKEGTIVVRAISHQVAAGVKLKIKLRLDRTCAETTRKPQAPEAPPGDQHEHSVIKG